MSTIKRIIKPIKETKKGIDLAFLLVREVNVETSQTLTVVLGLGVSYAYTIVPLLKTTLKTSLLVRKAILSEGKIVYLIFHRPTKEVQSRGFRTT